MNPFNKALISRLATQPQGCSEVFQTGHLNKQRGKTNSYWIMPLLSIILMILIANPSFAYGNGDGMVKNNQPDLLIPSHMMPKSISDILPNCGGGPCDADRWTKGAAWAAACPNNAGLIDDSNGADGGIVECGNAASTQSNIGPNSCYDPNVFTAVIGGTCTDPNTGLPTVLTPPLVDQQVLWFNFDVRAYAGGYDFQVIGGNEDIAWILYYSNTPQNCIGGFNPGISGNCNSLSYYTCGTSFGGWASQAFATPIFDKTTNVYLLVWDQGFSKGDVNSDNFSVIFKARYGCGENCAFYTN